MFKILDVVRLTCDLPEHHLVRGTQGVVTAVFDRPDVAFEVEFLDDDGRTTLDLSITPDKLELIERRKKP